MLTKSFGLSRDSARAWLSWCSGGVLLIALVILGASVLSGHRLEKYRTSLEARGETFSVAQLAAPKASKTQNRAADFLFACNKLEKFGSIFGSPDNDIRHISIGQIDLKAGSAEVAHRRASAKSRSREISWEEFRERSETLNQLLDEIRKTSLSPNFDFDVDYSNSRQDWIEFLAPASGACRFLARKNILLLHDGHTSEAVENVQAILRLAEALQRERSNIGVRLSATAIHTASVATWEILHANPSRDELRNLLLAWRSVQLTKDLSATLRFDRAIATRDFRVSLSSKTSEVMKMASSHGPLSTYEKWRIRLGLAAFYTTWAALFRDSDELQLLKDYQSLIDLVSSGTDWTQILSSETEITDRLQRAPFQRLGSRETFSRYSKLREIAVADSASNLTLTAVAIALYESDHADSPPESLSSLIPDYIPAVPRDIMDQQQIRYKKTGEDFLLYSVGIDGKDDGGAATCEVPHVSKDIVWPRPVTPTTSSTGSGTPPASPPSPP